MHLSVRTYHILFGHPSILNHVLGGNCKGQLQNGIPVLLEWKSCELIEMNIQKLSS